MPALRRGAHKWQQQTPAARVAPLLRGSKGATLVAPHLGGSKGAKLVAPRHNNAGELAGDASG